jgi:hypothetical protein
MSNLKFGLMAFWVVTLPWIAFPFGIAWGYKATPIAIICFAVAIKMARKLIKECEGK